MYSEEEWIKELALATFELGVDFPADAFESAILTEVQRQLLELYFLPQSWINLSFRKGISGTSSK